MELVYVALLLHKSGREINESNVKKVVDAIGLKSNDQEIKALVNALDGVDIEKEIKESAAMPAVTATTTEKKAEKKEEDTKKAEEAAAGLASLFGWFYYLVTLDRCGICKKKFKRGV